MKSKGNFVPREVIFLYKDPSSFAKINMVAFSISGFQGLVTGM